MTICNIHIAADRVWLASDSLQFRLSGEPHSFATKCSVFPHLYALAGFRGLAKLHHRLDVFMNADGCVLDVEDAAARLPDQLRRWRAALAEEHPLYAAEVKGQIWLAGWRPTTKAFGAWVLSSDDDFVAVELPVPSTHINPSGGADPPAVLVTPDPLVKVAEAQRQLSAANVKAGGEDLGIGGEVILVELTKGGFAIRKAFRFPDFAEVKERLRHGR